MQGVIIHGSSEYKVKKSGFNVSSSRLCLKKRHGVLFAGISISAYSRSGLFQCLKLDMLMIDYQNMTGIDSLT